MLNLFKTHCRWRQPKISHQRIEWVHPVVSCEVESRRRPDSL